MLIIAFKDNTTIVEINDAIDMIRVDVKQEFPLIRYVIVQLESLD